MTSEHQSPDTAYARTNRELFHPRENTGNPQYDFFTHYSRLSGLERLDLESHTINGSQISRYEPDISHSTTCVKAPDFISSLRRRAFELLSGAALVLTLSTNAQTFAAAGTGNALRSFDLEAVEAAQLLLSTDTTAPEFPALAKCFASAIDLHPQFEAAKTVDHSLEVKIAAPEYAARRLGNPEDAAEFVRCLHLIAGRDASALYLQQLASHYYAEAKRRPVGDVLKEMGLLALELSAVTATAEQLEFEDESGEMTEASSAVSNGTTFYAEEDFGTMSLSERRTRWMEYAAAVLGEVEEGASLFADELRAQTRTVYRKGANGFAYDEFDAHLSEVSAATEDDAEFGAYLTSFERVQEQYDEGFAVSLHMTDGERKVACGDLDEDVDADLLPECARHLGEELARLYTSGFPLHDRDEQTGIEGVTLTAFVRDRGTRERVRVPITVYGIDAWMDAAIDEAFGGRVARTVRRYVWLPDTKNSARPVAQTPRARLHEQTETIEVCPNPGERAQARAILEVLLQRLKRDYHTRGLHESAIYRELSARLAATTDTGVVARLKREAWQYKEAARFSIKLFNAFNTHAVARQAALEAEPLREARTHRVVQGRGFTMTQTFADGARQFIVAQPLLHTIPTLTGKGIADFARALHSLPRQEQERVRREFAAHNLQLYVRVRDGLLAELKRASAGKLRYFRWAFYAGNKPEHPVHILTREDQAAAWELLKARSSCPMTPQLPFVDRDEVRVATAAAAA